YLQGLELGEAAIGLIAEGDGLDRLVVSKIANDTHMEAGGGVEGQTKRVVPRKIILPKGTLEFPDLDDFKNTVASEKLRSGVYSIGRKLPIIAHWTDRESSVTLVTFSAALTKNAAPSVPIFS